MDTIDVKPRTVDGDGLLESDASFVLRNFELAVLMLDHAVTETAWIGWHGNGRGPKTGDKELSVVLRNGSVVRGKSARFYWNHNGGDGDILRYRAASTTRFSEEQN
jgi:hypothetical protein